MVFGFHQKDKLFMILSISVYSILQQHRQWSAAVIGGFPMMRTHMNLYELLWTYVNPYDPIPDAKLFLVNDIKPGIKRTVAKFVNGYLPETIWQPWNLPIGNWLFIEIAE